MLRVGLFDEVQLLVSVNSESFFMYKTQIFFWLISRSARAAPGPHFSSDAGVHAYAAYMRTAGVRCVYVR